MYPIDDTNPASDNLKQGGSGSTGTSRAPGSGLPNGSAGPFRPGINPRHFPVGFKLALVFVLTLAFLIPLWMLGDLTGERRNRQNEAVSETSRAWAGDLNLGAPLLIVPVDFRYRDSRDREAIDSRRVVIYPDQVSVEARLDPQVRQRGIFTIPLFSLQAAISGTFSRPSLAEMGADLVRAHWDQAYLVFWLPDFNALSQAPVIRWNLKDLKLGSPRSDMLLAGPALTTGLEPGDWTENASFRLDLSLKGSQNFSVLPLATATTVHLVSSWNRPSFFGSALPDSRSIGPQGLDANWKVVRFGLGHSANAPMENGLIETRALMSAASQGSGENGGGAGFGFSLYPENSIYQMTDRSLKYGILFIIIPFAALFLLETLRRLRIHPVQYLLIGMANCLFFLLLLAISEQASFNLAYAIATGTVIALCTLYCVSILPRKRDAWLFTVLLGVLYGYMFTALQSEDYALLIGSSGLVLILGGVMLATRKINWYRLGSRPGS